MAAALPSTVRIGTRASPLAVVQTMLVESALRAIHPRLGIEIEQITTLGDQVTDRPLAALGERAVFVAAIEQALRDGAIDFAVHSAKDLPSRLPDDMRIAAWLARADPRDALVTRGPSLAALPAGSRIGTSSPRRTCQLLALRPDLQAVDLRGNVGTRIDKLLRGEYAAIVLAMAGLDRLGIAPNAEIAIMPFAASEMIPAAAQGVLAIETRSNRTDLADLLSPLSDTATTAAVTAERAFLAIVGGGCHAVVGAFATVNGAELSLHAMVGAPDGRQLRGAQQGAATDATGIAETLGRALLARGGAELLAATGSI